jgi:uncharacterized membrane protein
MSARFGAIFGATLAFALLALYSWSTLSLILDIINAAKDTKVERGAGYIYVLTTVGGLVSALVIAQLSVTKPGSAPGIGGTKPESTVGIYATNTVVAIYLFVWIFTGLTALVVGVMLRPDVNKTISDLGTTWLGLAVSAAYAYFGIQPAGKAAPSQTKPLESAAPLVQQLQQKIDEKKITFDPGKPELQDELLRTNTGGTQITEKLQTLVLELSKISPQPIRIRELLRPSGDAHHVTGRAVDIGSDIASSLLPLVATNAKVTELGIDEIIFDAAVAGETDRDKWNYDVGVKHSYDAATLDDHKTHIHFAAAA